MMILATKWLAMFVLVALLAGCETTAAIRATADEAERALIMANDFQLETSRKGMCSSSFTAVMRAYAGHPKEFRAFMILCGVDESVADLVIDALP